MHVLQGTEGPVCTTLLIDVTRAMVQVGLAVITGRCHCGSNARGTVLLADLCLQVEM